MKIFISVGHGGKDSGSIGVGGIKESDLTLRLCEAIKQILDINDIESMLSRTSNVDNVQAEKIEQIKKYDPDLMLDIHFNSYDGTATGTEAYYQNKNEKSKLLAAVVSKNVSEVLKIPDRGAKIKLLANGQDYFGMLRNCPCTAILLETCFMDNSGDMKMFTEDGNAAYDTVAKAIVKAICSVYGLDYKEDDETISPTPENPDGQKFKIGDKVIINGALYSNSNAETANGNVRNKVTFITLYAPGTKHPYNTTGNLGWMNESDIKLYSDTSKPENPDGQKFKIGDKVIINGALYSNSDAETANGNVRNKVTFITLYAPGTKHPYNTTGNLGWMDEKDISLYSESAAPSDSYTVMTVEPDIGLYYHNNAKWNRNTIVGLWRKGTKVQVVKGSEYKYGEYTGCKVLYDGRYVYCAENYLK